jgi:methionyl-tRNA synthetase
VNSELVAVLGNFVNRTWVLMHKLCKGKVPPYHAGVADEYDQRLIEQIRTTTEIVTQHLEQYQFRDALFAVVDLARHGNQYMQRKEPWIVAKRLEQEPAVQQVIDNCLHLCLQLSANLAILGNPFLPHTTKTLCHLMKVVDRMLEWKNAGRIDLLKVGYSLREPQLLFRKIEDTEIEIQLEKLKSNTMSAETPAPTPSEQPAAKPPIQFDDFAKVELKVGTIVAAEKVEKADKLLKLSVDLGSETRIIVSGIALHHAPEDIVGKQVTVVTNLAPRKMRGIESNGMILMAEDPSGKLHFVNPDSLIQPGSGIS